MQYKILRLPTHYGHFSRPSFMPLPSSNRSPARSSAIHGVSSSRYLRYAVIYIAAKEFDHRLICCCCCYTHARCAAAATLARALRDIYTMNIILTYTRHEAHIGFAFTSAVIDCRFACRPRESARAPRRLYAAFTLISPPYRDAAAPLMLCFSADAFFLHESFSAFILSACRSSPPDRHCSSATRYALRVTPRYSWRYTPPCA